MTTIREIREATKWNSAANCGSLCPSGAKSFKKIRLENYVVAIVLALNYFPTAIARYMDAYISVAAFSADKIILFHTSICSKVNPLETHVSCDGYSVLPHREWGKTRSENIGFTYCATRLLPAAFLRPRAFTIKARLPFRRLQTQFPPFVSRRMTDLASKCNAPRVAVLVGVLTPFKDCIWNSYNHTPHYSKQPAVTRTCAARNSVYT